MCKYICRARCKPYQVCCSCGLDIQSFSFDAKRFGSVHSGQMVSGIELLLSLPPACSTEPIGVGDIGSILRKIRKTVSAAWSKT